MQLVSLIPILILLFNLLVSIDLVYTGICELVLELDINENNCSLRFIKIILVLQLQVVSALQIIVSTSEGILLVSWY